MLSAACPAWEDHDHTPGGTRRAAMRRSERWTTAPISEATPGHGQRESDPPAGTDGRMRACTSRRRPSAARGAATLPARTPPPAITTSSAPARPTMRADRWRAGRGGVGAAGGQHAIDTEREQGVEAPRADAAGVDGLVAGDGQRPRGVNQAPHHVHIERGIGTQGAEHDTVRAGTPGHRGRSGSLGASSNCDDRRWRPNRRRCRRQSLSTRPRRGCTREFCRFESPAARSAGLAEWVVENGAVDPPSRGPWNRPGPGPGGMRFGSRGGPGRSTGCREEGFVPSTSGWHGRRRACPRAGPNDRP